MSRPLLLLTHLMVLLVSFHGIALADPGRQSAPTAPLAEWAQIIARNADDCATMLQESETWWRYNAHRLPAETWGKSDQHPDDIGALESIATALMRCEEHGGLLHELESLEGPPTQMDKGDDEQLSEGSDDECDIVHMVVANHYNAQSADWPKLPLKPKRLSEEVWIWANMMIEDASKRCPVVSEVAVDNDIMVLMKSDFGVRVAR